MRETAHLIYRAARTLVMVVVAVTQALFALLLLAEDVWIHARSAAVGWAMTRWDARLAAAALVRAAEGTAAPAEVVPLAAVRSLRDPGSRGESA